jgi:hypothetical protein
LGVGVGCGDGVVGGWIQGIADGDGVEAAGVGVGVGDGVGSAEREGGGAALVVVGAGEGGFYEAVPAFGEGLEGGGVVSVGFGAEGVGGADEASEAVVGVGDGGGVVGIKIPVILKNSSNNSRIPAPFKRVNTWEFFFTEAGRFPSMGSDRTPSHRGGPDTVVHSSFGLGISSPQSAWVRWTDG